MRLMVVLFFLVMGLIGYFAYLNPGRVTIQVTQSLAYEIPMVGFFLLSMVLGALILLLAVGIRDARWAYRNWRLRKEQKRAARIQETLEKGIRAFFAGRLSQATGWLEEVLRMDPWHGEALYYLGEALRQQGRPEEAIRILQKARNASKPHPGVPFALVDAYRAVGQVAPALEELRGFYEQDRDNPRVATRLRDLYIQERYWEEACQIQERIAREDASPEAGRLLAALRYEWGRQLCQAGNREAGHRWLQTVLQNHPDFTPAYVTLGEDLIAQGASQEGLEVWDKGFQETGHVVFLELLEAYFLQQGDPDGILQRYHLILRQHPDHPLYRFYLGKLYARLEMLDEALEVLEELEPKDLPAPPLHQILGSLYARKEAWVQAVEQFQKALHPEKRVVVPMVCRECGHTQEIWQGRCPRCGQWNTLNVSPTALPIQSSAPPREPSLLGRPPETSSLEPLGGEPY